MENATRALLIAGGVLIAILIISVMVMLLRNTATVGKTYDQTLASEQISTFNSNFTKYLNKDLTIHEVVTICNFARENSISITGGKSISDLKTEDFTRKYKIIINANDYDSNGKIKSISITGA